MTYELKPCPNPECPNPTELNCGHAGGCWWVSCVCGCRGPAITKERRVIDNREDAIAAWNALPRSLRWTEYDGTESTLPKSGEKVIVHDILCAGVEVVPMKIAENGFVWMDRKGGTWVGVRIGDKWMPYPVVESSNATP